MQTLVRDFFTQLKHDDFQGICSDEDHQLTVFSTDNSIYERRPQAVIFPKNSNDVCIVLKNLAQDKFQNLKLTARGGGTGTNGQSLTDGIVLDLSRFMNKILDVDLKNRSVLVQCGVVKDQLNEQLKQYGLFFAPELSTSNRATIGGMINTDASGQGSLRYGKTHDHVLEVEAVLLGGEKIHAKSVNLGDFESYLRQQSPLVQKIYRELLSIAQNNQDLIYSSFPKLTRSLTGYDLPNLLKDGKFNPHLLFCGSEGTLAVFTEARLNLLEIPKSRALINVGYSNFNEALEDASSLLKQHPLSIETVDSKVLSLAKEDFVWQNVKDFFPENQNITVDGINIIEFTAESENQLETDVNKALDFIKQDQSLARLTVTVAKTLEEINAIYAMRKRSVGLLGNVSGEKRPQPFVEDTAVPPENLAAYIREFRKLLDENKLTYGMFGHVDAGVLHVRPLLDMREEDSIEVLKHISDEVVRLTHKYGGVLWGEHGKGLRSVYAPKFFGECWHLVQNVKRIFDPQNRLNPGKIATPDDSFALTKIDEVPTRGQLDRQIPINIWKKQANVVHCNGNAACFNYSYYDAMCPSWKATRNRANSPKGRAMLYKEFLRRQANQSLDSQFMREVHRVMRDCLACKACLGQCPVKVDIAEIKSQFLQHFYRGKIHPLRDYLIANLEFFLPYLAKIAYVYNFLLRNTISARLIERTCKLKNAPAFSANFQNKFIEETGAILLKNIQDIELLEENNTDKKIFIVQDAFTRYFDTEVFIDSLGFFRKLGIEVYVLPYFANGKPLQVQGFLDRFYKLRDKNEKILSLADSKKMPIVGLDPAMTMVFRQEYRKNIKLANPRSDVLLPQELLKKYLSNNLITKQEHIDNNDFYLASHCTEKTQIPGSNKLWQELFKHFGLNLHIVHTGCCGMSGTFGHELEHQKESEHLFKMSWQEQVDKYADKLLADGYSCRSQVKRYTGKVLLHPLQALLKILDN